MTPVKQGVASFGVARKATPSKPSGSANYRCFLDIANSGWTEDRSSELATMLMAQISAGRDINGMRRSSGQTALFSVVKQCPPFVVQAFLNHGADSSVVDIFGRSVLHFAMQNPNYKVARLIWRQISSGGNFRLLTEADGKGLTPLHVAFASGNLNLIGYILLDAYMGSIQKHSQQGPGGSLKPLSALIDSHQRNLLHFLLETNWKGDQLEGIIVIIEKLLELGVDRFAKDDRHRTPLKVLLQSCQDSIHQPPASAEISSPEQTDTSSSANPTKRLTSIDLAAALLHGLTPRDVDLSIMLMFKNDLQGWNEDWRPIQQVMQVGEFYPFLPLFVSLCSLEALVYVDSKSRSLWHYLSNMGAQKNVTEYYAAHFPAGANSPPSAVDPETGVLVPHLEPHVIHIRSLVQATIKALLARPDVEALLSQDLVFDAEHQSPLHTAAKFNNVVALRELYTAYGPESQYWKDANGATPLHISVQFNTIFVLLELRALGWQLTVEDGQGRTPYALAIEQKRKIPSRLLKAWGADAGPQPPDASQLSTVTSPRDPEDAQAMEIEPVVPAGEAAGSRLSASFGNLPHFLEPPALSPSTDRVATINEDEEFDDEEEATSPASDSVEANFQSISTMALKSALNAAKIRDEDAAEENNMLKSEIAHLKQELAFKEGEAKELESALNERPSIREYEDIKEKSERLSRINQNLRETVDELRQKVVDLELAVADQAGSSQAGLSPSASQEQLISEHSAQIQQLTIQLQETQLSLSAAQLELERVRPDSDILAQLRRQLDQTQAQLAQAVQEKLEAAESLRENENLVKKLYSDLEIMSSTLCEQANSSSPIVAEATRLLEEKERELGQLKAELESCATSDQIRENELSEALDLLKAQSQALEAEKAQQDEDLEKIRISLNALEIRCAEQAQEILNLVEERRIREHTVHQAVRDDQADLELKFIEERKNLTNQLSEVEIREESLRKESISLKSQLESQLRERETQAKSLELLEAATTLLKSNEEQLRSFVEEIQGEMAEAKHERAELMETNKTLISEHNKYLAESERTHGEFVAKVAHLSEELTIARKELAENVIQKDSLVSGHHAVLANLEREIGEQTVALNMLKEQLDESKRECERLRTTSGAELNVQQKDSSSLPIVDNTAVTLLKEQLREAKQEIQSLQLAKDAIISDSNASRSEADRKVGELTASVTLLTQRLEETTKEFEQLSKTNQSLLAQQLDLEKALASQKAQSSQWETQVEEYKKERQTQVPPSFSILEETQSALQRSLAESNGLIAQLKQNLEEANLRERQGDESKSTSDEGSLSSMDRLIGEIKELLANQQRESAALKQDIALGNEQMATRLAATQSALAALQAKDKLEKEHSKELNGTKAPKGLKDQDVLAELKSIRSTLSMTGLFLLLVVFLACFAYALQPSSDVPTIYFT